jgi:hypothetical protein
MTQADYVTATARNRKTIQRFLAKIKARPMRRGHHAADPDQYSVAVNLKVLTQWIGCWVRDKEQASGLAGATMAHAGVHDQAFLGEISRALNSILKRRKVPTADFLADLEAHKKLYSPTAPYSSLVPSA